MTNEQTIEKSPLGKLQDILNYIKFPSYLMEASEEIPFEQLLVSLDENMETEQPEYLMKIFFVEDVLKTGEVMQAMETTHSSSLQFYMELPLHPSDEKMLDIYRLVATFGGVFPYGSLTMMEQGEEKGIYYRYTILSENQNVAPVLAIEVLESTQFFITRLFPKLKEFIQGNKTREQIMDETQKELAEPVMGKQDESLN